MSLDRECGKCGEEYDARHGECPACNGRRSRGTAVGEPKKRGDEWDRLLADSPPECRAMIKRALAQRDMRPTMEEYAELQRQLDAERAKASEAIERAAVLDWVMDALRGRPLNDFALSFPDVVFALQKGLHACGACGDTAHASYVRCEPCEDDAHAYAESLEQKLDAERKVRERLVALAVPTMTMVVDGRGFNAADRRCCQDWLDEVAALTKEGTDAE